MIRRNVRRFAAKSPPGCLGHFLAGDPQCEAAPVCAWAYTCLIFRDWCARVGADPAKIAAATPDWIRGKLAWQIASSAKTPPPIVGGEMRQTLDRFLATLRESLPRAMMLHPGRDYAGFGELYYVAWKGKAVGWIREIVVKAKGDRNPTFDLVIARFKPPGSKFGPVTIDIRADLELVLAKYPQVRPYPLRWIGSDPGVMSGGTSRLGTTAVGVPFEHVDDFARLICSLIRDHRLRRAVVKDGLITRVPPRVGYRKWKKDDDNDRKDPVEVLGDEQG